MIPKFRQARFALMVLAALATGTANATYTTYFGEDLNSSASVPLTLIPHSAAAEAAFKAKLTGVGTETFESQTTGAGGSLPIDFPGYGGTTLTATLDGSGTVAEVTPGTTDGFGRYSIPSATSSKFWVVDPGAEGTNFTVTFAQDIAAFGFYGVDIGDFGGQLTLDLLDAGNQSVGFLTVNNTVGGGGSTDGSVLYFGLIAESSASLFRSIRFNTTRGSGDVFGFDNFTIGDQQQVVNRVPEPGSLALTALGLGLAGLSASRRKRRG